MASFAALAGAVASLVWLEHETSRMALPKLGPKATEAREIPLVLVDAGHGGHDGGAVANGGIEKHLTLDIARKLRARLEAAGLRVVMTRDKDAFLPLEERAELTARHRAALFVSVHINTDGSGSAAEGIETYFAGKPGLAAIRQKPDAKDDSRQSEALAAIVQQNACQSTGAEDRGIKSRDYVVVAQAACPAILVECGFLTNPTEAKRLKEAAHQEKIAQGIADGVAAWLKKPRGPVAIAAK